MGVGVLSTYVINREWSCTPRRKKFITHIRRHTGNYHNILDELYVQVKIRLKSLYEEMIKSTSDMDNYYSGPPRSGRTRPNYTNSTYANVPNQHISEPSGDKLKGFKQSDSRVSASLASTGKLTGSQNPYALYDSIDNDSLDDGIHMDLSTGDSGLGDIVGSSDQPAEDIVLREFADYMDVMSPMSEPEDVALRNTSTREKWTLLINQMNRSPVFNVRYYIENLKQNQGTRRKRFSIGKASKISSGGLGYVLHKLKLDLKMSPKSFLREFIKDPNSGLHLLVQILKELQRDKNVFNTAWKSKRDELEKSLEEEEDGLLCLWFLLRTEEGIKAMANEEGVYDLVSQTVLSAKARCRSVALKILSKMCCSAPSGFQRVMEAMNRQKLKLNEDFLFRTLCNAINTMGPDDYLPFLTSSVRFFNSLIVSTGSASGRVHLQHELEMAGYRPDRFETLARGATFEHDELSHELENWRKYYIDVSSMKDEKTTLESRNKLLRDEVSRKEEQNKRLEKLLKNAEKERKKTEEKADEYRERAAELQDIVEKLRKMYEVKTGRAVEDAEVNVQEVLKPLDLPADSGAVRSISTVSMDVPDVTEPSSVDAPPMPPAAPPMQPLHKKKVPTSSVELPLLNWTPLQRVHNTIFQNIDDDAVYQELDISDFESQFKLQRRQETTVTKQRRQKITQKKSESLHFVELNRAKNISITKHRTGLTSREIKDAIETCDITKLPGEYAELLIKFVPTKEEIKLLSQNKEEYRKMGEAEQFLFQLAQVERLESKLGILAFMGIFDELVHSVKPNINRVLEASNAVLSSNGLKKVFEIILAFGNFMNGSKRGYAMGFRLESLSKLTDVKSWDKQMTLMHYLVEHIQRNYPEFLKFYDDFNLNIGKSASYHALGQDVVWLRKGIDLVKFEKEKQGSNRSIEVFYSSASLQIAEIAENFKKMEEAYRDVCLIMGENYKMIEPTCFFGILADFFQKFKEAHRDISKRSAQRLPPAPKAPMAHKVQVKKSAPPPPEKKKEAPKIIAPLTPTGMRNPKAVGQQKKEEKRGPVTGQHNVMNSQTPDNVHHPTAGGKINEKRPVSAKKKPAPEPPPDYPTDVLAPVALTQTDHGYSKKYPAVKKVHSKKENAKPVAQNPPPKTKDNVDKIGAQNHNVMNGNHTTPHLPADQVRNRTDSDVYTAEMTDALAELDEVVEYGEQMAEPEEEDTYCSHL